MTNQNAETYIRLRWQSMSAADPAERRTKRIAAVKLRPHRGLIAVCDDLDARRDWNGYSALIRSQPKGTL
jgi:hypothetical protein